MRIVVAATIWGLFSCFLIFPLAGLPALMHRLAMTLLVAELVALAMWSYGGEECGRCDVAELGHGLATVDVPLSAAGLVAFATLHGVITWRRQLAAREPRRIGARERRRLGGG